MANHVRGEFTVTSHGERYTLVMDTNAMAEAEEALSTPEKDVGFLEVLDGVMKRRIRSCRVFVWAALRRHHPEMSMKDVGRFIDGAGGLGGLAKLIEQITAATRPDPEDAAGAGEAADDGRPTVAQADPKGGPGARSIGNRVKLA
jgi:hypothetical protein